ncbi:MAG: class I tRNA ligase family protein, partial [Candidatus Paceibacterota bacterium]
IENKRFYVWWEAVIGYFSASLEWSENQNNKESWKDFWYGDNLEHFYFMGKDNLPFHVMFWPGELHLYDDNLHLPDVPVINQFLNFEGDKFSKSRGVVIDSKEVIEKYGLDPVRFYLTSIMPEKSDSSFGWSDFADKHNNILIGNLGNFINRTLTLSKEISVDSGFIDDEVKKEIKLHSDEARNYLESAEFRNYLDSILKLSDFGNKYLTKEEPWKKEGKERDRVISNSLLILLTLQTLIKPLLVDAYDKLKEITGVEVEYWTEDLLAESISLLEKVGISDIKPLFSRIEL